MRPNRRTAQGFITALALAAPLVFSTPAQAQTRPWSVTLEGAVTDLHGETAVDGAGGALRLSRRILGYDWMRAEVAFTGGSADEDRGFGTAELGIEFRWCNGCRVTPFIGGGGGWLKESHWDGGMLRGNVGVEARVSQRLSVRLMGQAGTHDGVRGPNMASLGLTWHFGTPSGGPANRQ